MSTLLKQKKSPKLSNRKRKYLICAILSSTFSLVSANAIAADILPSSPLDSSEVGGVTSADTSKEGTIRTGVSFRNSDAVLSRKDINRESQLRGNDDTQVVRDTSKASMFLGTSLSNSLELSLGLHGTNEIAAPSSRDEFLVNSTLDLGEENAVQDDWRDTTKETGFSGASFAIKAKLVDWKGLKIAVQPFIESGIGEKGSYTYTRSVNPKTGWSVITTYGQLGVAEVTLQGGYRYRNPEVIGDITFRNEVFGGFNAKAWLSRNFAFFASMQGRSIKIAKNGNYDDNMKLIYEDQEAGEVAGGFVARFDKASISAFIGSKVHKSSGFGYADTSAGFSLSYEVGSFKKDISKTGFVNQVKDGAKDGAKDKNGFVEVKKPKPVVDSYEEMKGSEIDPLAELKNDTEEDDFVLIQKKVDSQLKDKTESDDSIISRELEAIKAIEKEEKIALEKAEAKALAEERAESLEQQKEDAELMKQWTEEANDELKKSDGISDDEVNWDGLNH